MSGNGAAQKRQTLDVISVKRNPYLVDYEEQKRRRAAEKGRVRQPEAMYEKSRRYAEAAGRRSERYAEAVGGRPAESRAGRSVQVRSRAGGYAQGNSRRSGAVRTAERQLQMVPVNRRGKSAALKKKQRRRQRLRRRLTMGAWVLCSAMICCLFVLKQGNVSQAEQSGNIQELLPVQEEEPIYSGTVQGIPAAEYAKHPAWTEDFLPVNEYSRPGEELPEVNDIFVHYTANPGTSAAQNRSYFEQQKDMHEASVSAHFIIGYDGEILQCVPLDEIAYAVQTRNYDSISIECCYTAEDGSFTQATYDSLISLLAWLTDAYGLDTEHILRHYDCGGKKCPIYYTEHEDAWERLKNDVEAVKV